MQSAATKQTVGCIGFSVRNTRLASNGMEHYIKKTKVKSTLRIKSFKNKNNAHEIA